MGRRPSRAHRSGARATPGRGWGPGPADAPGAPDGALTGDRRDRQGAALPGPHPATGSLRAGSEGRPSRESPGRVEPATRPIVPGQSGTMPRAGWNGSLPCRTPFLPISAGLKDRRPSDDGDSVRRGSRRFAGWKAVLRVRNGGLLLTVAGTRRSSTPTLPPLRRSRRIPDGGRPRAVSGIPPTSISVCPQLWDHLRRQPHIQKTDRCRLVRLPPGPGRGQRWAISPPLERRVGSVPRSSWWHWEW
jgi:hypothetical protein